MPGALELVVADDAHLDGSPLLKGKTSVDGKATAYVCTGTQCSLPVTAPEAFASLLRGPAAGTVAVRISRS